jgi:hypothetical protein
MKIPFYVIAAWIMFALMAFVAWGIPHSGWRAPAQ